MTTNPANLAFSQLAPERSLSQPAKKIFTIATAIWAIATVSVMMMFYVGTLDFVMSSRLSMYAISIWLNAWVLVWFMRRSAGQEKIDFWHEIGRASCRERVYAPV